MSEIFFRPMAVADNASVAVKDGQFILETSTGYTYIDWKGARHHAGYAGPKGDTGPMPDLTVSCAEGSSGVAPSATVTEVDERVRNIHFVIPKGEKGDKGERGERGADGAPPAGVNLVNAAGSASGGTQNVISTPNFNDDGGSVSFNRNALSGGTVGAYKFNDGSGTEGLADVYAKKVYSSGAACLTADEIRAGDNVTVTKADGAAIIAAGPFSEVLYSGEGSTGVYLGDETALSKYKMLFVKGVFSNSSFSVCTVIPPDSGVGFKVFTQSVSALNVVVKTATLRIDAGVLASSSAIQGTKPTSASSGWTTTDLTYQIKEVVGFKK